MRKKSVTTSVMTRKDQSTNHRIKFLMGYGFSVKVKDSKIVLKN